MADRLCHDTGRPCCPLGIAAYSSRHCPPGPAKLASFAAAAYQNCILRGATVNGEWLQRGTFCPYLNLYSKARALLLHPSYGCCHVVAACRKVGRPLPLSMYVSVATCVCKLLDVNVI